MDNNKTVVIHGAELRMSDLQAQVEACQKRQWRQQRWVRRDALMQRDGGMLVPYVGQAYNAAEFEVVRGGWKHNHCEICYWDLCESNDPQHSTGYTDGRRWLCTECHDCFIRRQGTGCYL